jgi:hypothetical protein
MLRDIGNQIYTHLRQDQIRQRAAQEHLADFSQEERIPQATALRLCREICQENSIRWYRPAALKCRFCVKFAQDGVPALLVGSRPGYSRCPAVNMRYRQTQIARG